MKKTLLSLVGMFMAAISMNAKAAYCTVGSSTVDFTNFHQDGAAYVGFVNLSRGSYVEYRDVYNLTTITLVENNQIVASSSSLMKPVHLKYNFHGTPISCYADDKKLNSITQTSIGDIPICRTCC